IDHLLTTKATSYCQTQARSKQRSRPLTYLMSVQIPHGPQGFWSPPPLWGRVRVGGELQQLSFNGHPPPTQPSPTGGRAIVALVAMAWLRLGRAECAALPRLLPPGA